MNGPQKSPGRGGTLAIVAGGALLVICCAGPALLAGGAVSALGGALHSPWLVILGVLLVVGAAGFLLQRHRGDRAAENCCTPEHTDHEIPVADDPHTAGSDVHRRSQP